MLHAFQIVRNHITYNLLKTLVKLLHKSYVVKRRNVTT